MKKFVQKIPLFAAHGNHPFFKKQY